MGFNDLRVSKIGDDIKTSLETILEECEEARDHRDALVRLLGRAIDAAHQIDNGHDNDEWDETILKNLWREVISQRKSKKKTLK